MAFALQKNDTVEKKQRRSPLAGWLGRKAETVEEDVLPELDIAGGVTRALKGTGVKAQQETKKIDDTPVREALGAIEAALYAIDKIRDMLEQACEVAISAKDNEDAGGRALLAERYDEMRLSVDAIINEADPRAVSLIGKSPRHLDVKLCGKTRYSVASMRLDTSDKGIGLSPPRDAFSSDEEIDKTLEEIDRALGLADRAGAGYCRDAQYLIARMNGAFE